jgi:hypothetical protein
MTGSRTITQDDKLIDLGGRSVSELRQQIVGSGLVSALNRICDVPGEEDARRGFSRNIRFSSTI